MRQVVEVAADVAQHPPVLGQLGARGHQRLHRLAPAPRRPAR
ncbi:hypothetical protein Ae168Ps1_6462c [Pseudonocardia sp. Ae168_Ps1]|nr:hypothetical protein Ae168Ps1_6462c [Pseudonocardia sp. Ae168_Ps1]OLL88960.1 hypothetical protein Ae356Ps1_6380c [Pseudonocardia sp. Ae356_Ps1]